MATSIVAVSLTVATLPSGASPQTPTSPAWSFTTTVAGSAVVPYGGAPDVGSLTGATVNAPIVGIAPTSNGGGYWLVGADGGVYSFGDARFSGSLGALPLAEPVVGMAPTPDGGGYWLVAADGGVFTFGDAVFHGSLGGVALTQPIVGISSTPDGGGYWLVAADGGIFAFGDARFSGSLGALPLAQPVVGMAPTPDGGGYWLVAADGGIFAFGDAPFAGSLGATSLAAPIVGIAPTLDGGGYWLVGADGGVFTFGDAPFDGSLGGQVLAQPVVGLARSRSGYWLSEGQSTRSPFTPALIDRLDSQPGLVTAAVENLNTGELFTYHPGIALITASIVKVQFLGTLLAESQASGQALSSAQRSMAAAMIEASTNSAATSMLQGVGGPGAVDAFDQSLGMTGSNTIATWGNSTTTATDQLILLKHFIRTNATLSDSSRSFGLSLMAQVIPADIFGVSAGVPSGMLRAVKTGRIPSEGVINGIAWVQGQGRDYLIAILTQGVPDPDQNGLAIMNEISTATWDTLVP